MSFVVVVLRFLFILSVLAKTLIFNYELMYGWVSGGDKNIKKEVLTTKNKKTENNNILIKLCPFFIYATLLSVLEYDFHIYFDRQQNV